jgi:hypothetical protein
MNVERCLLSLFIGLILVLVILTRNHFSVVNHCVNTDDVSNSRQQIIPLGHEDEDAFVFVHVRI